MGAPAVPGGLSHPADARSVRRNPPANTTGVRGVLQLPETPTRTTLFEQLLNTILCVRYRAEEDGI
jgi:hypothetical protein